MLGSIKPWVFAVVGVIAGFILGAFTYSFIVMTLGSILAQFDSSLRVMGDVPGWVRAIGGLVGWGMTILGGILGYRMGSDKDPPD